jgi:hypothetical protein
LIREFGYKISSFYFFSTKKQKNKKTKKKTLILYIIKIQNACHEFQNVKKPHKKGGIYPNM